MEKCPFCGKSLPEKTNYNNNAKGINKNPIKKCPFCAEEIKAEAIVCKHCGRDLTDKATIKTEWHLPYRSFMTILGILCLIIFYINIMKSC
jgi:hypothetical protein